MILVLVPWWDPTRKGAGFVMIQTLMPQAPNPKNPSHLTDMILHLVSDLESNYFIFFTTFEIPGGRLAEILATGGCLVLRTPHQTSLSSWKANRMFRAGDVIVPCVKGPERRGRWNPSSKRCYGMAGRGEQ
jgi:hypothetical protein